MARKRVVLLVEPDAELRDLIGGWLEEAGYDVLVCPGPSRPDYSCVAGRGKPCPLAHAADVVVLDLWLASDSVLEGTSSFELLSYYLRSGKPVVAMAPGHDQTELFKLFLEESLVVVEWPPERQELLETMRALWTERPAGLQRGTLIRTVVPSPGVLSIDSCPPREAARSRRLWSP